MHALAYAYACLRTCPGVRRHMPRHAWAYAQACLGICLGMLRHMPRHCNSYSTWTTIFLLCGRKCKNNADIHAKHINKMLKICEIHKSPYFHSYFIYVSHFGCPRAEHGPKWWRRGPRDPLTRGRTEIDVADPI